MNLELENLLNLTESEEFDCKRAEIQPAKALETICAFANSQGGTLAFGLEDPLKGSPSQRVLGIKTSGLKLEELLNLIEKEFNPPLLETPQKYEIDVVNNKGETDSIILLKITKSKEIHSLRNGNTFIRRGSSNYKIGVPEITKLSYEKGTRKYENELAPDVDLSMLDHQLLNRYKKDVDSETKDSKIFLKNNGLATAVKNQILLTKAGVLLFAHNPAIALKTKCSIKISHYYGKQRNYSGTPNFVTRPFTIEGSLLHQIQKTVKYYQETVRGAPPKLIGSNFFPSLLIPEWAFQEAVTNAVIHRNYYIEDDIQIRIFDDRIEIASPGTYPGHITPQNIRNERFARNVIIQRTLNRFKVSPNLDIGEGVERIFQAMREHNLYEPLYLPASRRPNKVELHLFNMQKIDYWDTVKNYLLTNYKINNQKVRELTNIANSSKVSRMLKSWVEQGLIEKINHHYKGRIHYKLPGVNLIQD